MTYLLPILAIPYPLPSYPTPSPTLKGMKPKRLLKVPSYMPPYMPPLLFPYLPLGCYFQTLACHS